MAVNRPPERVETFLVYHVNESLCVVVAPNRAPSDYLDLSIFGVDSCEQGGTFLCTKLSIDQTNPGLGVEAEGWILCFP